ncbi:purine nucleoside permease protein [Rutstroemia sp. NJR-2017a WRK4]|nr:purine nucleoside permease protein [Rutstroemia sp. NJR-2017a WRK4]
MKHPTAITALLLSRSLAAASQSSHACFQPGSGHRNASCPITPKVFIIDMFSDEGAAWYGIPEFDVLAQNITVPGISPLFPQVHCTADGQICQVTTGEGGKIDSSLTRNNNRLIEGLEINAAITVNLIAYSPLFDLRQTYFLIAGIAGVSPKVTTIGAVTFARFAVSVALQYEIDAREKPTDWTTGYFPQGGSSPTDGLVEIYGTEVFEVNEDLKQLAMAFARNATLNDTADAIAYRALYGENAAYALGAQPPGVVACDTATSDVYFTGELLGNAFENTTSRWTNGSGVYCSTQQEDNATLEALLRAATTKLVDFSRIIIMRTASDFDRPHNNQTILDNLLVQSQGYDPSIINIYLAGVKVVEGILSGWNSTFAAGVKASNYVGDVLGTLGGQPDFLPSAAPQKRGMKYRRGLR